MKRKRLLLMLAAVILTACAAIQPALAYFTSNSQADGAIPITLGSRTEIQEDFKDWTKTVSIENTEGSPVWIRARAYAGVTYPLVVTGESGWYDGGDGWWYYSAPVAEFETTANLYVSITGITAADAEDHQFASFNVAVVYESTRVHYGEDGEPLAADWNAVLDTGTAAPPAGGQD